MKQQIPFPAIRHRVAKTKEMTREALEKSGMKGLLIRAALV